MDVEESLEELLHHLLDLSETEFDIVVGQKPCQVMLTEVKYKVEGGAPAVVGRGCGWGKGMCGAV